MIRYGPPERVYVENDWYDGPREGIADINGVPHRFKSLFDDDEGRYLDTFLVWPVDKQVLELEIEQWGIFVEWNVLYRSGKAATETHPGHGGRNARWDELEALLDQSRTAVPVQAKRAVAQLVAIHREMQYGPSGPSYMLSWKLLD
ncbi:hypothetical protein [Caldimonas brevitalea]|uniref:Uncharacterized protein n=1 Tax=Caldimonas brevitalea TaxID=413882 RepID=A0A0G3BGN2_9BURK|nr:hypothetical protein [Caldimonas brevitalea]AKJ27148.1 hypothetical protein AAW51_0457 [Caldimonas brevitalea]